MNDRITVADGKYTFRLDTSGNFHSVSAYPRKAFASVQDMEVALGALIRTALDAIDRADTAERRLAEAVRLLTPELVIALQQGAWQHGQSGAWNKHPGLGDRLKIHAAAIHKFLSTLETKETTDATD